MLNFVSDESQYLEKRGQEGETVTQNKRLKVTSVNCADLVCPESPLNLSHPQTIQSPPLVLVLDSSSANS